MIPERSISNCRHIIRVKPTYTINALLEVDLECLEVELWMWPLFGYILSTVNSVKHLHHKNSTCLITHIYFLPYLFSSIFILFHIYFLPYLLSSIFIVFHIYCLPYLFSSIFILFHIYSLPYLFSSIFIFLYIGWININVCPIITRDSF